MPVHDDIRQTPQGRGQQRRNSAALLCKLVLATGLGLFGAQATLAQTALPGTIKLVVAYAPGGATDIVARMLAAELSSELNVSMVVDNRAGGGTLIGSDSVRRATPDGSSFLFGTNAFVITPLMQAKPGYDPVKDFTPVAITTIQSLGMLVPPGRPFRTVKQLIEYGKANPGKINFASSGNGSAQHLAGESFAAAAGISMTHVPYKGAGPALIDLLGDRVDVMFTSMVGNTQFVQDGKLLLLATTGRNRSPATPNTPTVAESGMPGLGNYEASTWQGFIAPLNTPKAVVDRVNAALVKVGKLPKIVDTLAAQGMEVKISSADEMQQKLASETSIYRKILEKLPPAKE